MPELNIKNQTIPNAIFIRKQLPKFYWEISDIGLDNELKGRIDLSMLEHSCRKLVLGFDRDKEGEILKKNEEMNRHIYLFEWEYDFKTSSLVIWSEHSLFYLKTKWSVRQVNDHVLQLFYPVNLSNETLIIAMLLKKSQAKKRNRIHSFVEMNLLPLFLL